MRRHQKKYEVDELKKKIGKMIANIDLGKILPEYFLLTMGSVILAINFDLFLAPFNIAPGGTSGAAIIIHKFTGWPKGLTMLILTLPMLVVGFFYLGWFRFLVRAFMLRWFTVWGLTDWQLFFRPALPKIYCSMPFMVESQVVSASALFIGVVLRRPAHRLSVV
jgi:uncharacterized membrane-anchored protein YitT (DUF2179 family)